MKKRFVLHFDPNVPQTLTGEFSFHAYITTQQIRLHFCSSAVLDLTLCLSHEHQRNGVTRLTVDQTDRVLCIGTHARTTSSPFVAEKVLDGNWLVKYQMTNQLSDKVAMPVVIELLDELKEGKT